MPFRPTYDCLWCGHAEQARDANDLGGWSQLCADCLGKAGENGFLRARLKAALAERSAAIPAPDAGPPSGPKLAEVVTPDAGDRATLIAYYEGQLADYDDWYARQGRYERGPVHDAAFNAELDAAGRWLDALPMGGEIVELAAGTGWWSPLLASKGELSCYDAAGGPLDRARERLVAHGLRAHLHVRDAWAEPDREVDALFTGFWLIHVPRAELIAFLELVRRWLRPGGTFAFIDLLDDASSGATDQPRPTDDRSPRRLADGQAIEIVEVYRDPAELRDALERAGFAAVDVTATGRFFVHGSATA